MPPPRCRFWMFVKVTKKDVNREKNQAYKRPVLYLYYNERGQWTNIADLCKEFYSILGWSLIRKVNHMLYHRSFVATLV